MKDSQQDNNKKKKYEKPRLRRMELRADEVLAVGCKTPMGGGPAGPNCIAGSCISSFGS